jgi:hypothetical protein
MKEPDFAWLRVPRDEGPVDYEWAVACARRFFQRHGLPADALSDDEVAGVVQDMLLNLPPAVFCATATGRHINFRMEFDSRGVATLSYEIGPLEPA